MNYEELYKDIQVVEKSLAEKFANNQKCFRKLTKNSEKGDLKSLEKDLAQMKSLLVECGEMVEKLSELTGSFDNAEYFINGDFAKQMIDYCEQYSVDVKGEFPVYEMFPFKVRIDAENQDLYVNRKKVQCLRPLSFIRDIKRQTEKYLKAPVNIGVFLNELVAAYDLAVIVKGRKSNNTIGEFDILLKDLYDYLAPMQRVRRVYDLQNYAFDLARLYTSEIEYTKDNRRFEFGSSKQASKLIRILDANGNERFLGTIRFYRTNGGQD